MIMPGPDELSSRRKTGGRAPRALHQPKLPPSTSNAVVALSKHLSQSLRKPILEGESASLFSGSKRGSSSL
jgi:hypothetical protein